MYAEIPARILPISLFKVFSIRSSVFIPSMFNYPLTFSPSRNCHFFCHESSSFRLFSLFLTFVHKNCRSISSNQPHPPHSLAQFVVWNSSFHLSAINYFAQINHSNVNTPASCSSATRFLASAPLSSINKIDKTIVCMDAITVKWGNRVKV